MRPLPLAGLRVGPAVLPSSYRSSPHYLESRCVAHGLLAEEAADPGGRLGQPVHVTDGGLLERLLAAQWPLAGDGLLEVGIQTFIGVEFGAVGRQVEDLDLG